MQVCPKKTSCYSKPCCLRLLFISKWSKWVQKSRYCEEFHNKIALFEEFFWRIYIFCFENRTIVRNSHYLNTFFALVMALFRGVRTIWGIFLKNTYFCFENRAIARNSHYLNTFFALVIALFWGIPTIWIFLDQK